MASSSYDVFINFRGADTRKKFVCHLHSALETAGVKAFFDEKDLPKGYRLEELLAAIERSKIAIVVFSKNYGDSTWCLDELAKIIECHETYCQRVLPVFYEIEPSDVRHQRGDFGKALRAAAQKRFSGELPESALKRWSSALTTTVNFAGWGVSEYRNEAELVKTIVKQVLNNLEYELSDADFPIGVEPRVQKVIRLIGNQSTKVRIIGIWGMGGSGKTTIAKAIYDRIRRSFMHKSFIEDIRDFCQTEKKGLVRLQKKLLSDVLKTEEKITSDVSGATMIQSRLSEKKALIVLDDVNELKQLKALCGKHEWFGHGSVIIITTRDLRLLEHLKVDYVYKMEEMDENESLELLSRHAFEEANPREDFIELARSIVDYCGGLPLALEALGRDLRNRTRNMWSQELSKLKLIPHPDVQKILKLSYADLSDEMQKNIFLDVCCAFIGKDRGYVTEILNGCGLPADLGIAILTECSLIKVEKNNKLRMHNLLRDMGRDIIRESSNTKPGKRSRLWFQKDVLDVLEKNTGTEAIEGLTLKLDSTNKDFKVEAFKEMRSLRLLRLDNVNLSGDYGYLSEQLKWICWQRFPLESIPNSFNLEGAIAVDLKRSNLTLPWSEPQVLQCLKILNLSHSMYLRKTPDFSTLPNLEKLILKHCPNLDQVHGSIGDLCHILLINLKGCTNLSNFPREIYKLESLKTLIISGCSKIDKLEEDIVHMKSLTTLVADNIALKQLPFSIVSSKSIGYVSLCECEGLSPSVFPSIIWSYMSSTINPLSCIRPFCGTSSSPFFMNMKNSDLSDLAPILRSVLNLRSILVQCDAKFQKVEQVRKILDEVHGLMSTELETTPSTTESSKHSLEYYLIRVGANQEEVFNSLIKSISEGLATRDSCSVCSPRDHYPCWFEHTSDERHSVHFTVPKNRPLKGMTLCVVHLSAPETKAIDCLISVLMVNYTKLGFQLYKRDTVISFNDVDWQGIISHLGPGEEVEIFVTFRQGLLVKKVAVHLMYDESSDMEIEPVSNGPLNRFYDRNHFKGNKLMQVYTRRPKPISG